MLVSRSLSKIFLRPHANALPKQISNNMSKGHKDCCSQPKFESLIAWISTLKNPHLQMLHLFINDQHNQCKSAAIYYFSSTPHLPCSGLFQLQCQVSQLQCPRPLSTDKSKPQCFLPFFLVF